MLYLLGEALRQPLPQRRPNVTAVVIDNTTCAEAYSIDFALGDHEPQKVSFINRAVDLTLEITRVLFNTLNISGY